MFILKTNIPCFGLIYRLSPDLPLDKLINPPCNPPNSSIRVSRTEGCCKPWTVILLACSLQRGMLTPWHVTVLFHAVKTVAVVFFINMSGVGHNNMCLYCILRQEWPTMGKVWTFKPVTGEFEWHIHVKFCVAPVREHITNSYEVISANIVLGYCYNFSSENNLKVMCVFTGLNFEFVTLNQPACKIGPISLHSKRLKVKK